jgi:hypothetical protein
MYVNSGNSFKIVICKLLAGPCRMLGNGFDCAAHGPK